MPCAMQTLRTRHRCAPAAGGDVREPLGAGWAPLREPSLRSGSLRSAQPAPRVRNHRGVFLQGLCP